MQSKGVRAIAVLAGGTALAQLITLASLPVLTRLFTPEDFALLAVFVSLAGILSVIGCARLEMAIPIPADNRDGGAILIAALLVSAGFSVLLWVVLFLARDLLRIHGGDTGIGNYLLLVPLAVWFTSSSLALQYWLARVRRFHVVSQAKISRSASGSLIQIGTGWLGLGPIGLILGQIVIGGAGGLRQVFNVAARDGPLLRSVSAGRVRALLKEYRGFSLYSSMGALSNSSSSHVPVLIIAAFAVGPEAGFLMLATRVMSSPISLIGSAVSQVYVSRAPEADRAGNLGQMTVRTLRGLIKTAVAPLVMLGVVAPVLFAVLFGQEWYRAGEIVTLMTPWIIMQFLATPVAPALQVTRNERLAFALQTSGLMLRVGLVAAAALWRPEFIVEAFLLSGFIFYFAYLALILRVARPDVASVVSLARLLLVVVLLALLLALVVKYFAGALMP